MIFSGRWLNWWTVPGDWVGWRGDWCFFLVGGSFDRLCQVIGWAGGVNGVFFCSVVHLVNCVR